MHLIQSYALQAGAMIDRPFIYETFFPLEFDKFITLHGQSKDSKTYDYWAEVVTLLRPILDERGIKILQIGAKEDRPIEGTYNIVGRTNLNQAAYLVKRALLHLSVDTFTAHLAGAFDKKLVCLYSNNYIECVKPFWGNSTNQILLEPKRKDTKPSFALSEFPKTINSIAPELIAKSVLQLLEIEHTFPYRSVAFGTNYLDKMIETVPNQVVDLGKLKIEFIAVRMDFEFNEEMLKRQLGVGRVSIITSKVIDLDIIRENSKKIVELVYYVDKNHNPDFIKEVKSLGIRTTLYSYESKEFINNAKLEYMDLDTIHEREIPSAFEDKDPTKLFYKSNKFTLSNNKIYPSKAAWIFNKPINTFQDNFNPIINDKEFWRESHNFYILEKKSN